MRATGLARAGERLLPPTLSLDLPARAEEEAGDSSTSVEITQLITLAIDTAKHVPVVVFLFTR